MANAKDTSAVSYTFEGDNLLSVVQNTPNLANLRNDFSLWGTKKSVTGQELPVHMRYAIDKKPDIYKDFDGNIWCANIDFLGLYVDGKQTTKSLDEIKQETKVKIENEIKKKLVKYTKTKNTVKLSEDW